MKAILFVDDEVQILKALKRLFTNSQYDTYYAESATEALEVLDHVAIDLVITDIRMPDMDGFQLLKQIKTQYPKTIRIALSGYTDSKSIYNALEDNLAKLYIFKPWDNKELINTVNRLFDLENHLNDSNLLKLINNISHLPTVPDLYNEICKLIEDDSNIEAISKKLEKDQSIASKILKVANSAFYGAKTGNITQAIMYIGLINVKNIVLSNSVFNEFGTNKNLHVGLWEHVNATNKIMNSIYVNLLRKKVPNVFASAGLLHDVGRVIVLNYYLKEYDEMIEYAREHKGHSMTELEKKFIGTDHQMIGGYLLNWWEIPLPIVEAATYHHDPLNENVINKELVSVVHLANYYSWDLSHEQIFQEHLNEDVFEFLNLNKRDVELLIQDMQNDALKK